MSSEPTEMAGVAEAETQAAYAWALDDGVDDLPTQRLTSRRITALSLAASLAVIAVAGVVALLVIHNVNRDQPEASPPPPPDAIETVTRPTPPSPTPPPPQPPRVSHAIEENFVAALRAPPGASWQHVSWAMIPGGGADTRDDDALLVTHGYEACDVMDRYPAGNRQDVAYTFYSEQGFNMESIASFPEYYQEMTAYMDYAARYLCQRNSATSPVVQLAPPPVKAVEPPPAPTPGCTEGATRVSQGEGDISTCENGQWHEGPYGYLQKPAAQPHGGWCDGNGSVEAIAPNGRSMFCVTGPDGAGSWEYGP